MGVDFPSIPIIGKEDQVLFSEYYSGSSLSEIKPMFNSNSIAFPMSCTIDIGRKRAGQSLNARMTMTVHISEKQSNDTITAELCNPDDFDAINAFAGLKNDPVFNDIPTLSISNNYKKLSNTNNLQFNKTANKILSISPLLTSFINVHSFSSNNSIIALEFQMSKKCPDTASVDITDINVEMSGALLTPFVPNETSIFPQTLGYRDQASILYKVNLFDTQHESMKVGSPASSPSNSVTNLTELHRTTGGRKGISIAITLETSFVGLCKRFVTYFCSRLPLSSDGGFLTRELIPANYGRLFESTIKPKLDSITHFSGLQFSLNVMPPINLHKVFSVQLLIANTGVQNRRLVIEIPPIKSTSNQLIRNDEKPPIYMGNKEFINEYIQQTQTKSSIICLENRIELKPIPPKSCRLIMLHYIVIQGRVHDLPVLNLFDQDSNEQFILKNTLQIFV
ncbi:hypothetical protein BC833DRAFT_591598, partial [Globomyces pollinis-pini]